MQTHTNDLNSMWDSIWLTEYVAHIFSSVGIRLKTGKDWHEKFISQCSVPFDVCLVDSVIHQRVMLTRSHAHLSVI